MSDQRARNNERAVEDAKANLERCYAQNTGVRSALRQYERALLTRDLYLKHLEKLSKS